MASHETSSLPPALLDSVLTSQGIPPDKLVVESALELGPDRAGELQKRLDGALAADGVLALAVPASLDEPSRCAWRNALWPWLHLVGYFTSNGDGRLALTNLQGRTKTDCDVPAGQWLVLRRSAYVLSPEATTVKFDANAQAWNGEPGSPGYPHYRWMRRYVGLFTKELENGLRVLDFGCGAGWVGIEAATRIPGSDLAFFDPSPAMVKLAEENARESGLTEFTGRVGFGDEPPFPAEGEPRFDLVISSGVISFAPDTEHWLDGLTGTLAPGGTLIIGDINLNSRGFRKRRANKSLLPVREMNAQSPAEIRKRLEQRGFAHEESSGYQLTYPIPQAMHVSETRLRGALSAPLLWLNRGMAQIDRTFGDAIGGSFDSWVMRLRGPH